MNAGAVLGKYYLIDFDSTFVKLEALDELAKIALKDNPDRETVLAEIEDITRQCMEGKIPFDESLAKRLALFRATNKHIEELVEHLKMNVTASFERNKAFLREFSDSIYIVSGGFAEYIKPVVQAYGIREDHVLANSFVFDDDGTVAGYDETNPLSQDKGKVKLVGTLDLGPDVSIIGDGYSDYQLKEAGVARTFYAFTENVRRAAVVEKADVVVPNLDDFLYINKLPRTFAYPKSRIKVLLLENIHDDAAAAFDAEGYQVEQMKGSMSEAELLEKIPGVAVLGIRSNTKLTDNVLRKTPYLLTVGAFCIGTNQIDLAAASRQGIAVFNAPFSNTRSVVELAMCEIIALSRRLFDKSVEAHSGVWNKSAVGSREVRGKKLGIVGYGNIGSQLSVLAENFGMEVCFYDVDDKLALGNAKRCETLTELLEQVDVVTVHVDGRASNKNLIGEAEFKRMKPGALFLNLSRGHVVEVETLAEMVKSGHVAGAAVDVYPTEPKGAGQPFATPLAGLPNVILTPHIAGSTEEAQRNIGKFVATKIINHITSGTTAMSVNLPNLNLPQVPEAHRFTHMHRDVPGILARINTLFADHHINIVGQHLGTNEHLGYVISDVNKRYSDEVIDIMRSMPETIRLRVLY